MNTEIELKLFQRVELNRSLQLSTATLSKGIDNYHIDVKLSKKFSSDIKKLASLLVSQIAVPHPKNWDNTKGFEKVRNSYLDMMTVLIHRIKTDLNEDEICFLQFAAVKHILRFTRTLLENNIQSVNSRLTEHRNKGSSEALATDQHLFWLKKNFDSILYAVNKQIFNQLQRVEDRQLDNIRNQYLNESYQFSVTALTNPLLFTSELSALSLLVHESSMWSWSNDDADFSELNRNLEKLLNRRLKAMPTTPLLKAVEKADITTEIHDELGGLFATHSFLGLAEDTKEQISEDLSWLELPDNIDLLFSIQRNSENLKQIRKQFGFKQWWRARRDANLLKTVLKSFMKMLKSKKLLPRLFTTQHIRRSVNPVIAAQVELKILCQYLSGNIESDRLQDSLSGSNKLNGEQLKSLEQIRNKIREQITNTDFNDAQKLLLDICKYRRNLKLFRFAHRAFNRLSLRTAADEIKLSKAAGTLYQLPTSAEIEEDEERICHHAILKADVRGSTTVTDELQNKGLNPASYFSMRFFNPINKILETYGANKVFIEGDAIILSFLEYEHTPQQWFSVARACGYARDMLKVVGSNNRYSTQMGLPLLELGVGICYSDEAPRYLYDEDKPIMISRAIGLADRMSSCSWILRAATKKSLFNVDVMRIVNDESDIDDKGQNYIRYNVNGILMDDVAFRKLRSEMSLTSLRMKLNAKEYLFHVGQYADTNNRKKDLVIREARIGIWRNGLAEDDPDSEQSYFEVVVNRKVIPLVLDAVKHSQSD